jgi:rhodanese-related sulfurtransferase
VQDLKIKMDTGDFEHIVDVRTPAERESGYVPKTSFAPMTDILEKGLDLPVKEEVILVCGSGYRSNIVASKLKQNGFTHVHSLAGGMHAWSSAGFELAGQS